MALRKVPGALALGLLASLIAHGALYRGAHSMGGDYHELLIQLAFAGSLALALVFGCVAWSGAKRTANGSVLAAKLSARLPGLTSLIVAATLWYAAAESLEPHHAGTPLIAVLLVLAASSWAISRLCRLALAVLAGAILAIFGAAFAERRPAWLVRQSLVRTIPRRRPLRRRFARPPPIAIAASA